MFGKYILHNFKRHPLRYIMIILLEAALICAALTACGIAFDTMTNQDYIHESAKEFTIAFMDDRTPGKLKKPSAGELRKPLDDFIAALPVPYGEIAVGMALYEEQFARFSGTYAFWKYPDYDTMVKQLEESVWKLDRSEMPTREQFENNERVAIVGTNPQSHMENGEEVANKYNFTDENHIMIAGDEYLVTGRYPSYGVHIFFDHVPDDTVLYDITLQLKDFPNKNVINEVKILAEECFGNCEFHREPRIDKLLSWRSSLGNILLAVLTICMSVFNILLIFKFLLASRQKYFAVLRLCGYKKSTCVVYSMIELLIISLVSSIASFVVFRFWLSPFFAKYYNSFSDVVFSPDYYAALYGLFLAANVLLFAVYIAPSFVRSVREELSGM